MISVTKDRQFRIDRGGTFADLVKQPPKAAE